MNARKRIVSFVVLMSLACVGASIAGVYWLRFGCIVGLDCAPNRSFSLQELALPAALFPTDAKVGSLARAREGEGAREHSEQEANWDIGNSFALLDAKRLGGLWDAEYRYNNRVAFNLKRRPYEIDSDVLGDFGFVSQATEYLVVCEQPAARRCSYVARYQEYLIEYIAHIDDQYTMGDFIGALMYLDNHLSERLSP